MCSSPSTTEARLTIPDQALFLSLKPRYAHSLVDGAKRVELRRIRPRAPVGTIVMVYAASPQRELIGTCVVEAIGDSTPDEIWRLHGPETGLRPADFWTYFQGAQRAVAITVRRPHRFAEVIGLDDLRACWPAFQPPQSFRYLPVSEVADMLRGTRSTLGCPSAFVPAGPW